MAITSNPQIQNGAVSVGNGTKAFYNLTANTLVKASAGRVAKISVIATSSTAGSVHDAATIAGGSAANGIAIIPAAVGVYTIDWPCANGIVVKPGTGQTVAISFN